MKVGGEEGIVHNQQKAIFFCQCPAGPQIRHIHHGVAGSFNVEMCIRDSILETEFGIEMTKKMEREVHVMCN